MSVLPKIATPNSLAMDQKWTVETIDEGTPHKIKNLEASSYEGAIERAKRVYPHLKERKLKAFITGI